MQGQKNKQEVAPGKKGNPDNVFLTGNGEKEPRSNYASPSRANEKAFNLVIDEVPYLVKTLPFSFNGETRFYISINGGNDHVFTWDSEVKQLRAIDDEAGVLPEALEEAISQKLQS